MVHSTTSSLAQKGHLKRLASLGRRFVTTWSVLKICGVCQTEVSEGGRGGRGCKEAQGRMMSMKGDGQCKQSTINFFNKKYCHDNGEVHTIFDRISTITGCLWLAMGRVLFLARLLLRTVVNTRYTYRGFLGTTSHDADMYDKSITTGRKSLVTRSSGWLLVPPPAAWIIICGGGDVGRRRWQKTHIFKTNVYGTMLSFSLRLGIDWSNGIAPWC